MSKKCTNCGAQLAAEAAFCPHCATPQREKTNMMPPKRWRRTALRGTAAILLLAAVCLSFIAWERRSETAASQGDRGGEPPAVSSTPSATPTPSTTPSPSATPTSSATPAPSVTPAPSATPEPTVKGAEAVWKDGEKEYRLALSFYSDKPEEWRTPTKEISIECHPSFNYKTASNLYVWDGTTGQGMMEEFEEKLAGIEVTTNALSGKGLKVEPATRKDYVWESLVGYNAQSGTGEICWTLTMKNGDKIELVHRMTVSPYPTVIINSENAQLDTVADLQATLDAIDEKDLAGKYIFLDLPGVTYTEPVVLPEGMYEINCADGKNPPNFAGGLTISGGEATCNGILFAGDGGTGITADGHISLYDCTVSGWDTGVIANDGAWASIHGSTFENNGVGLHFNSQRSNFINTTYDDNTFRNNGIAMLLEMVPFSPPFTLPGTLFSGNEVDIDSLCGKKVDISLARFVD